MPLLRIFMRRQRNMNYQEMSDHEISCEVGRKISFADYILAKNKQVNYCNSWADAGPIIQENGIAILPFRDGIWTASSDVDFLDGVEWNISGIDDKNPLRAAMVVFLMMKGGE